MAPRILQLNILLTRVVTLTVIRRTHRVVESLQPTEFPFKSLRVFDRKRLYLVNRR